MVPAGAAPSAHPVKLRHCQCSCYSAMHIPSPGPRLLLAALGVGHEQLPDVAQTSSCLQCDSSSAQSMYAAGSYHCQPLGLAQASGRLRCTEPTLCVLQAAVLGFVGSPWTLATYVVEGASSGLYKEIKTMIHTNPQLLDALLSHLAEAIGVYSNFQIDSGAQCIQLFDSWGGQLPPQVS